MTLSRIIEKASSAPYSLSREELVFLLSLSEPSGLEELFSAAYALKKRYSGNGVNLRGIIEMGNVCAKDCYYCGIRKGNKNVERFELNPEALIRAVDQAVELQYGSLVLQSGEIESDAHTDFIEELLRMITERYGGIPGITLSLGEQSEETYARWYAAGAHRYLLRIETSNPGLYRRLHPDGHDFSRRINCLNLLRKTGYQTGSGVLIGFPGQTAAHLADDILFFHEMDLDMIGMGPYIPHHDTPLGAGIRLTPEYSRRQLYLGLKMIAVTRLFLHTANIASTTALQALADNGRELGVLAGANVIMPNITDTEYRKKYQLYDNKPCLDENSEQSLHNLVQRLETIGETINWNKRGDSPHYKARTVGDSGRD